jgi:hypothetical protein
MLNWNRNRIADEHNELTGKIEPLILAKKKPFYDARKKIIAGGVDLHSQNFGDLTTYFDGKHEALKVEEEKKTKARTLGNGNDVGYLKGKKGIPGFWVKAIKNHKLIMDQIMPHD